MAEEKEGDVSGSGAASLPTPQDTPYRTPSGTSKMSRRDISPPATGASPPPIKERNPKRLSKDITVDESISILDPRRFTPTLHANLVSEILGLRRDQEEKTKLIESLEQTLDSSMENKEDFQSKFTAASKENRSLKRQLALLEGGTSSALGELARERDEAVETTSDMKQRLDTAQKKIRSQEDDSERVHDLWARDKDSWENERRKFERKVHVAESRLKTVLDEVAAFQAAQASGATHGASHGHDSDNEGSVRDNDAGSVRSMSMTNSIRFSFSHLGGVNAKAGNTLADELDFDDEDDQTDRESVYSDQTGPTHTRTFSRDSVSGKPHHRNQSFDSLKRPGSVAKGKLFMNESVLEALEGEDEYTTPKASYTDTGVQCSPPPSPKIEPVKPETPEPVAPQIKMTDVESPSPRGDSEIEANQRRKRVQISPPAQPEMPPPQKMVSASCQTVEEPLSPPRTPKTRPETPPPEIKEPSMITSSTQTEDSPTSKRYDRFLASPSPPPIPSISIQPPLSRPTTPKEPRLPPHFKHFGCQVSLLSSPVAQSDVGVQTEGIKVDKRLAQLPPHLQPSAISSRPSSPVPAVSPDQNKSPVANRSSLPPRNPRRLTDTSNAMKIPPSPTSLNDDDGDDEFHDAYPGNNDDGPLSNDKGAPVKRPHRFSSLFAGFDTASSDEGEFGDEDASDTEYRTALSAPRPQSTSSRPTNNSSPTETVGTYDTSSKRQSTRSMMSTAKPIGTQVYSSFSLSEKDSQATKSAPSPGKELDRSAALLPGPGNRASVMRKAAMIQSGIATHGGRSRSPSLPDTRYPPFPIPQRASSRKPSSSAPTSEGQRSPTRVDGWQRRSARTNVYRQNSIRKVRSAAALPRHQRYGKRSGSRSPPPLSPSTEAPESPGLPPLPRNDITTPARRARGNSRYRKHRQQPSNNTENTNATDPTSINSSGNQTTSVVDAIAQTMVGEWMFKYVRRRKSFGVPEATGKDDSGNDRHKRWVWLAPYERAILWSSKQPSSGSALMGKTGRKLVIQSVLDVKDDNPTPKGVAGPVFNRSILILTPQRALKFTATSAERHYIWLTALSFLAHSSQAVPEIMNAPQSQPKTPQPQALPEYEPPPQPKSKRSGIRDSIRLAKGRTAPIKSATPSIPSIPSAPSSQMGEKASLRTPDFAMGAISTSHNREQSGDIAEPPLIPRFTDRASQQAMVHGRKRSNTGGHTGPPISFRGFSGPLSAGSSHNPSNSTAGNSVGTAGSSDYYYNPSQGSGNTGWGMSQTASQRTSEASSRPGNFFDAIGTMRMEAFISPLALGDFAEHPNEEDGLRQVVRRRSKELRRRQSRRSSRTRDSYSYASRSRRGSEDRVAGSRTAGEEDYFRDDPFRGF